MREEVEQAFLSRTLSFTSQIEPLSSYHKSGNLREIEKGKELLISGKVGTIVLAGGLGTRLGWQGPKGTFPLTPFARRSLLQFVCDRRRAASNTYGTELPLAFMVSPNNEEMTKKHLEKESVDFFVQGLAPFLDLQGKALPLEGPSGNGEVLHHFYKSGLWHKWKEAGVEILTIVPIDNPLADPFDANLIGFHHLSSADVTVKAILRERADEQLGVLGSLAGKLKVVEYFELPEEERSCSTPQGLKWSLAHITLFCMNLSFAESVQKISLPWHFARKDAEAVPIYKCEKFIFDLLDYASSARLLVYPREETYAPLKNQEGENSPESVRKALLAFDQRQFFQVSGTSAGASFELDPAFYYPTEELKKKWAGKQAPRDCYVAPML